MELKLLTHCSPTQVYMGIDAHRRLPEVITRLGAKHAGYPFEGLDGRMFR